MDALKILGPAKLRGTVAVSGSKNTALPLLFSSILFEAPIEFENVPRLWDIETTLHLLGSMGATWSWDKDSGRVRIDAQLKERFASYEWVRKMRAGILALGPLVARYGEAKVSLPGGCAIGARPVDYHLSAMQAMGVELDVEEGYIHARVPGRLRGADFTFPRVSVTGTENVLMLAPFADGDTTIRNAAREPEILHLGEHLRRSGAEIAGLGTDTITVRGGTRLRVPRAAVRVPADRIEAGTWIATAIATQSSLTLTDCDVQELKALTDVFVRAGVEFTPAADGTTLRIDPPTALSPVDVETEPYPGFPTDMQAQLVAALLRAPGASRVTETIFENRFLHVAELKRLGADIGIEGHTAIVRGGKPLRAAPLMATDLRASASLVIGALMAQGESVLHRIYHLDRGYQQLDRKLRDLGVEIIRFSE